jgi:hypothetical protein
MAPRDSLKVAPDSSSASPAQNDAQSSEAVLADSLAIGLDASAVAGLAGVMNGQCIDKLGLKTGVLKRAVGHTMERMEIGLARKM